MPRANDNDVLWDSADMARRYKRPNAKAFMEFFARDRLKPADKREVPDPINPQAAGRYLWEPSEVRGFRQKTKRGAK